MLQESSLEAINGKIGVCILEMSPLLESVYRYFVLLLSWGGGGRGELIVIQADSQVVDGHESELEG